MFGNYGKRNPAMFLSEVPPSVGGAIGDPGFVDMSYGDAGDKAVTVGFTYRVGSGGYTYKQYPNGDIQIAQTPRGPSGVFIKADPSNQAWIAITSEIGPTAVWQAFFKQKGYWPAKKRSVVSSYAQAAAASASRSGSESAGGSRGQGFLSFLQQATGVFQAVTQAQQGTALPGQGTVLPGQQSQVTAPPSGGALTAEPVPQESGSPPYLLYGIIGVSAVVILGVLLSGRRQPATA